jgi:2-polyprenyl-3-methyl-5-hydroxy-6-metoxy-1,4-benzoquinol methylase
MQTSMKLSPEDQVRKYEEIYRHTNYGIRTITPHRMVLQTIPKLVNHEVQTVLEIGCGRGILLKSFELHGFNVIGTEIVGDLICHELAPYLTYPYSIVDLPRIESETIDFVLSVDVLDHISHDEVLRGIQESWRIASKGMCILVNGESESPHQTVRLDSSWWREKIESVVSNNPIEVLLDKSGACRFLVWKGE